MALLVLLIFPSIAQAHVEPIKTDKLYRQEVMITGVSIVDDDNWFGSADIFFDYIVDALEPPHDKQEGYTIDTVAISSGESIEFDPPIVIYSHDTCHCDEQFDIDVAVFDYAPVQSFLVGAFWKGLDWLRSYFTGHVTGLMINVVIDSIQFIADQLAALGMSDEEAEYEAYVKLIENSDFLGAMREIVDTACSDEPLDYEGELNWQDDYAVFNGTLSYRVTKTWTGDYCPVEEAEAEATDDEGKAIDGAGTSTNGAKTTAQDESESETVGSADSEANEEESSSTSESCDDEEEESNQDAADQEGEEGEVYGPAVPGTDDDTCEEPAESDVEDESETEYTDQDELTDGLADFGPDDESDSEADADSGADADVDSDADADIPPEKQDYMDKYGSD